MGKKYFLGGKKCLSFMEKNKFIFYCFNLCERVKSKEQAGNSSSSSEGEKLKA
jgi:hypothetical protein